MKTNTILQLILSAAIVALILLLVRAYQEPTGAGEILDAESRAEATTKTLTVAQAPGPEGADPFPSMDASLVFKTLVDKPTPRPTRTRTPRPKPTPDPIKKIIDSQGWRLADAYKGRATIEATRKKDGTPERWVEIEVGKSVRIYYNKKNYDIKLLSLDEDNVTATFGCGTQPPLTLRAF